MNSLEDDFHEAMLNIYKLALKECNYRAKAFLGMVVEMGGLAAAKKLLASDEMQSGLYELFKCGRLDLTMETLALQTKYRGLFTTEELAEAQRRIEELERKSQH